MAIYHTPVHTLGHQQAWTTWEEGVELLLRVGRSLGVALVSLSVMPDHIHPLTDRPAQAPIRAALSGYTRWLNHRTGRTGPLFAPVPEPLVRKGTKKILRDQRYVELNACRGRLVDDPLAWPLSTWRERMGLACPALRKRANDPARWFRYATRDDYVVAGDLPYRIGLREPSEIEDAVSSIMRVPLPRLRGRGAARTLFVASLRDLTDLSTPAIADIVGLTPQAVRAVEPRAVPGVAIVRRVAGDPRFTGLHGRPLDFGRYCEQQRRNARGPGWAWE